MSTNLFTKYLTLCASVIAFGTSLSLPAIADDGAKLDEIIVTARKREESLTDVPESVMALSGTAVERRNIKGVNKIGLAVPNVNLSNEN